MKQSNPKIRLKVGRPRLPGKIKVMISIDRRILKKADEAAETAGMTRSAYIEALIEGKIETKLVKTN
jgi:metal-responsive CopG/Arc/MetJ family transcriptional regulator